MRILKNIVLGLVALLVAGVVGAVIYYRDIPAETIEAKYGTPDSQFMDLDGIRLHFRDEGAGPAVLLMHAHWDSLVMWDSWAEAMTDSYRVVRFDPPGRGLSSGAPTGDYSMDRFIEIVERFTEARGIDDFYLGGTSIGGTIAIRFAAKHPDRVKRLILVSPGALNERVRGSDTPPELPFWIDALTYVTPRAMFGFMLRSGYGDPEKVTDEIIDRWWEMQLAEGHRAASIARQRQYISGNIVEVMGTLTMPTLIMWGEENPVVTVDQAYETQKIMAKSDTTLIIYDGVGHMAVNEAPERTAADARAYLDAAEAAAAAAPATDALPGEAFIFEGALEESSPPTD